MLKVVSGPRPAGLFPSYCCLVRIHLCIASEFLSFRISSPRRSRGGASFTRVTPADVLAHITRLSPDRALVSRLTRASHCHPLARSARPQADIRGHSGSYILFSLQFSRSLRADSGSAATFIPYHTAFPLSTTFLNFFHKNFHPPFGRWNYTITFHPRNCQGNFHSFFIIFFF